MGPSHAETDLAGSPPQRKIIHIDMDAFYALVEQRDNPDLRGKPVAVGGSKERGVVAAASYEARTFGVRSAMPSVTAKRQCPELIFVMPRFEVYKEISRHIRSIFAEHTELIELYCRYRPNTCEFCGQSDERGNKSLPPLATAPTAATEASAPPISFKRPRSRPNKSPSDAGLSGTSSDTSGSATVASRAATRTPAMQKVAGARFR